MHIVVPAWGSRRLRLSSEWRRPSICSLVPGAFIFVERDGIRRMCGMQAITERAFGEEVLKAMTRRYAIGDRTRGFFNAERIHFGTAA